MAQTRTLLTVREICERLRVSPATVFRLVRAGTLAPIKIGRRTLFAAEEVEALIDAGRQPRHTSQPGPRSAPAPRGVGVVLDALRRAGLLADPTPERRRRAAEYDARHGPAEQARILGELRSLSLDPPLSEAILRSREQQPEADRPSSADP